MNKWGFVICQECDEYTFVGDITHVFARPGYDRVEYSRRPQRPQYLGDITEECMRPCCNACANMLVGENHES